MQPTPYLVTFKERDDRFIQIQRMLDAKTKLLQEKHKYLHKIKQENSFLNEVLNDYAKYGTYIVQQKKDQMMALQALNEYIEDLKINGKLTKQNIEDAKMEQRKILSELDDIKNYLDDIIEK
jgi:hypothetical protein